MAYEVATLPITKTFQSSRTDTPTHTYLHTPTHTHTHTYRNSWLQRKLHVRQVNTKKQTTNTTNVLLVHPPITPFSKRHMSHFMTTISPNGVYIINVC